MKLNRGKIAVQFTDQPRKFNAKMSTISRFLRLQPMRALDSAVWLEENPPFRRLPMLRASGHSPFELSRGDREETPAELSGLPIPFEEWHAIVALRPNILIEGTECDTERFIGAVTSASKNVAYDWDGLPPETRTAATVIVRRVDLMGLEEQRQLLQTLDSEGARPRQILATSARPLYPLVEAGRFPADLYYRLNTIRIELGDQPTLGH
jgi:hypothetical protein